MLKLKKEKIFVSLIVVVMIALVVGNVYSLATEGNNTGIQLTQNTSSTNTNKANTTANTEADVGAEVGATNTNSSKNNTNTNKVSNNAVNNTKNTNSNTASSGLPYAGSNTSIIFIVIALVVSAIYAYKKVSDYNV